MSVFESIWMQICAPEVNLSGALFKLALSMTLGSVVGLERKRRGQSAGVRTFALISMGATLAMLISIYVPQVYLGLKNGDPGRIAAQVISGIGFLGAGAIIQMKGSVRGLTTAAGIWMVATIGLAVGVGMYLISIAATGLIIFILVILERWEHHTQAGNQSRIIRLRVNAIVTDIDGYRRVLAGSQIHLSNVYVEYEYAENITRLNLLVLVKESMDLIPVFERLRQLHPTLAISLATQVSI